MEPLEVIIELRTPVALGHPWIHFDGIISHLVLREKLGEEYYLLPTKRSILRESDDLIAKDVPIAKIMLSEKVWMYRASVGIFDAEELTLTTIYKRFTIEFADMIRMRRKSISIASGKLRNWSIRLPYVPTSEVRFYAVGIASRIEELLHHLPGLGKKVAIGFGDIRGFEVRKINEDRSLIYGEIAMRPIPTIFLEKYDDCYQLAFRPPYWEPNNVTICAPPGCKAKLRRDLKWTY